VHSALAQQWNDIAHTFGELFDTSARSATAIIIISVFATSVITSNFFMLTTKAM
jgi:hypothetical protein